MNHHIQNKKALFWLQFVLHVNNIIRTEFELDDSTKFYGLIFL